MQTQHALLGLTLVMLSLIAPRAGAEPTLERAKPTQHAAIQRPRVELEANVDFGVVRAPFFTPDIPEVRAHGVVLSFSGRYAISPSWQLGARLPVALMSVRQPAGSFVDEGAWGNPSLFIVRRMMGGPPAAGLTVWVGADIGLPLAEHGPSSLLENQALEAANALEAYRSPEAFTPGVLPLVPRAGARFEGGRWSARAELGTPLLVRMTEASLTNDVDTHALGFLPDLELSGSLRPARLVELSLATNAAWAAVRVTDPALPASRFQLSLSPSVQLCFTHLDLALTFRAPLGGALGGSTFAGGLTLRAH